MISKQRYNSLKVWAIVADGRQRQWLSRCADSGMTIATAFKSNDNVRGFALSVILVALVVRWMRCTLRLQPRAVSGPTNCRLIAVVLVSGLAPYTAVQRTDVGQGLVLKRAHSREQDLSCEQKLVAFRHLRRNHNGNRLCKNMTWAGSSSAQPAGIQAIDYLVPNLTNATVIISSVATRMDCTSRIYKK